MDDQLKQSALDFHEFPVPGKIQVSPTKPLATQRDLALAYSPGVAAPCLEIEKDPLKAYKYTARGNLVAVISNGTAVLGLGNIGALAGKPVMEGKGVLFKKFAGIDVFDIEVDELDPDKFIEVVAALEPTFGGITETARADEYSGIPRRSARHGNHQHCRHPQRLARGGEKHLRRADGGFWRGCRSNRLYEPAGSAGSAKT